MLELNVYKNNNTTSRAYGNWYARVENKKELSIYDMAVHMAQHNTPFSVGTINGILCDFVSCIREQCLEGHTVKIDNLAIFKCSVHANPVAKLYDAQHDVTIRAAMGAPTTTKEDEEGEPVVIPTGNAVKKVKLLALSTGNFTREELSKDVSFRWTKYAQDMINKAKEQPQP